MWEEMAKIAYLYKHWRQNALNSAGALQDGDGEFRGIFPPFYTIKFWGQHKSGGARATMASPSLAPLYIKYKVGKYVMRKILVSTFHCLYVAKVI